METLILLGLIALVVAIPILHLYTFFTEAGHLNRYPNYRIIILLLLTGTYFIYFVSPSARRKGLLQIGLSLILMICLLV